jgi:hypothetical protein
MPKGTENDLHIGVNNQYNYKTILDAVRNVDETINMVFELGLINDENILYKLAHKHEGYLDCLDEKNQEPSICLKWIVYQPSDIQYITNSNTLKFIIENMPDETLECLLKTTSNLLLQQLKTENQNRIDQGAYNFINRESENPSWPVILAALCGDSNTTMRRLYDKKLLNKNMVKKLARLNRGLIEHLSSYCIDVNVFIDWVDEKPSDIIYVRNIKMLDTVIECMSNRSLRILKTTMSALVSNETQAKIMIEYHVRYRIMNHV